MQIYGRGASLLTLLLVAGSGPAPGAMSIYLSPEELAARAPLVVEGIVLASRSGWDPEGGTLSTYVTLGVDHVHRGPTDLEEIVIREPGGAFGGLVHAVDAVPVYEPGERVLVFLEPSRDGALRTAGMFFGKYTIEDRGPGAVEAVRDLSGQGLILGDRREAGQPEALPLGDLVALVASSPAYSGSRGERAGPTSPVREWTGRSAADPAGSTRMAGGPVERGAGRTPPVAMPAFASRPPEYERLLWGGVDDVAPAPSATMAGTGDGNTVVASPRGADPGAVAPYFAPLSTGAPTRWNQSDSGTPVSVDIERAGNPLGDGAAAVDTMRQAMAAWSDVPEARVRVQTGNDDADFTTANASPARSYPPVSVILFDDPYGDISDPSGCSGTLAIGGYWRSGSPLTTVNGEDFYPALRLYVIFNNSFQCFLGNAANLAEVGAHEVGHGLGFGHSTVADAIMRAYAYGGGRGARLGDDDSDAAHCHYPHVLTLLSPTGGEWWTVGSLQTIAWTTTVESGPDAGEVDLEYSVDGGLSWTTVASGEPNDGSYDWTVPDDPSVKARFRVVRPNRVQPTPAPYPAACSEVDSVDFTIAPPMAGNVPDGAAGAPLLLAPAGGGDLTATWGASCSAQATDYALYEGGLAALHAAGWDHLPVTCSAGTDLTETFTPSPGSRYYLAAALTDAAEGGLGSDSDGAPRPASASACLPREAGACP